MPVLGATSPSGRHGAPLPPSGTRCPGLPEELEQSVELHRDASTMAFASMLSVCKLTTAMPVL